MIPTSLLIKGIAALALIAAITFALWRLHAAVYDSGYRDGYAKLTEYQASQVEQTREVIREVEKIVVEVQERVVYRNRIIKEKGDVIVARVPVYITKTDDAACELRAGFVRIHDGAASNDPPGPAAESDRNPAAVDLSEALRTVSKNYALYHACRAQVIGWNEFWSQYSAALSNAVCLPKEAPQ